MKYTIKAVYIKDRDTQEEKIMESKTIIETKTAIQTIYEMLWDILSMYDKTRAYNISPLGMESDDIWDIMTDKFSEVRKKLNSFFLKDRHVMTALEKIIFETEIFVRSYEVPGVVTRWKQINENIVFFDCAFDLMNDNPDIFKTISRGLSDLKLSTYPDKEFSSERNEYFKNWEDLNKKYNLKYSDNKVFQNELLRTLTMVFRHDFEEYL